MKYMLKIRKLDKPKKENVNNDINWLCDSLGLSSGRDTLATRNRILYNIIKKKSNKESISSEVISSDLGISQGLVNHHVRKLIDGGIIRRRKGKILIRGGSLKQAIKEMKRDAVFALEDIEDIAEEIDEELGISIR